MTDHDEVLHYDDTVTVTVTVQFDSDDADRDRHAAEVAQQYQAAMWQLTPAHGRLAAVDATLPDWQPTSTYTPHTVTIAPRLRVYAEEPEPTS